MLIDLKNKVYIQVIRALNELFRFMALKARHIWFTLHLSEVRFTTRTVIPMDMDGVRWIPINPSDSIRQISVDTMGQHLCPLWFSSDFRYSSASNISYFRWKVLRIDFCLFHQKKTFPLVCIGNVWKKVYIYLFLTA